MKVMTVVGTRPEAIKMAPVVRALERTPGVTSVVCASGQHRDMLREMLAAFRIRCDHDLDVMCDGQTLTDVTVRVLSGLERVLAAERPDWVLVQGDTTTVLAASLAAFYQRVRVGHVEAGLRTHDKWQPYPEEINRRITDVIGDLYFAPTAASRANLLAEGVADRDIVVTGNTVVDALLMTVALMREHPGPAENGRRLVLVTAHRRENHGAPIRRICEALLEIARRYRDDVEIVYPVHPNPNIQGPAGEILSGVPNISLLPPQPYFDMVRLMSRASVILTDSGGLQEEAPTLRVPVLVLRESTERPEGVRAGVVRVVGTEREAIVAATVRLLDDPFERARMTTGQNPYGDGRASERIVDALVRYPSAKDSDLASRSMTTAVAR